MNGGQIIALVILILGFIPCMKIGKRRLCYWEVWLNLFFCIEPEDEEQKEGRGEK